MRRFVFCCFLLMLSAALFGCVRMSAREGEAYPVYFLRSEDSMGLGDVLMPEPRVIPPDMDVIDGLLNCLLEGPEEEELTSSLPSGVTVKSWSLEDGLLIIDFSARYATLSGISLSLADYSIVKTMTQLEQVDAVEIKADGDAIFYRNHQSLTADDIWDGDGVIPAEKQTENVTISGET